MDHTCPRCGAANPEKLPFCNNCGAAIDKDLRLIMNIKQAEKIRQQKEHRYDDDLLDEEDDDDTGHRGLLVWGGIALVIGIAAIAWLLMH